MLHTIILLLSLNIDTDLNNLDPLITTEAVKRITYPKGT